MVRPPGVVVQVTCGGGGVMRMLHAVRDVQSSRWLILFCRSVVDVQVVSAIGPPGKSSHASNQMQFA